MSSHIVDQAMPFQASESPAIFTLPNEIIGEVINLLSSFEVAQLRLTCKKFAGPGERNIFEAVHVASVPEEAEDFLQLSQQPKCRKYVKKFFYDIVNMGRVTFEDWQAQCLGLPVGKERVRFPKDDCPPLGPETTEAQWRALHRAQEEWDNKYNNPMDFYTAEQLAEAYANYQDLLIKSEEYAHDENNLKRFISVLGQFPNLQEVEIRGDWNYHYRRNFNGTQYQQIIIGTVVMHSLYWPNEADHVKRNAFFLEAMVLGNLKIKRLKAHELRLPVLDTLSQSLSRTTPDAMTSLKCLDLSFRNSSWAEMDLSSKIQREVVLGKFLRQATGLEFLFIQFDEELEGLEPRTCVPTLAPRWERITGNMTWPRLRTLHLLGVNMTEDHITSFMRRHSSTLKDLFLLDIFLQSGTWNSTFRQWKDCLALEEVEFRGIFGVCGPYQGDFNPEYHLTMSKDIDTTTELELGGRESLGKSLKKFFTGNEINGDFLEDWTSGKLPDGVVLVEIPPEDL